MFQINTKFNKFRIPLLLFAISLGGIFLFQYLTFIPEHSSADSISTTDPVTLPKVDGTITTKFGTEAQGYKTYMQEISLSYCQSLPDKTTGQLADGRDGKIYWVTVLGTGDAKTCWMTQDLDYDLNGQALITKNSGDNFLKGSDADWSGRDTNGNIIASSDEGWPTDIHNNINWYERNKVHGMEHTSLGNLYSYEAVTAGTGSSATENNQLASGSICPAGWKLPTDNSGADVIGSFTSLDVNGNTITDAPYYFQYGGTIIGKLGSVGNYGNYWSATVHSPQRAYYMYFYDDGRFNSSYPDVRYYGMSVRCVVRDASYVPPVAPSGSINNPNISVQVPNIITLDVSDGVDMATESGRVNTGEFTATVSSNKDYSISINAAGDSTSLVNYKDGNKVGEIKTIEGTEQPTAGISSWGIMLCNNTTKESCTNNYLPLPTKNPNPDTINPFVTGTKGTHQHLFQIGIGIGPELPSGTYTTSIQVTASQK